MKFISFVQCKAKIHYNKIHALVTTWPQEQFFNPTQILTHSCILQTHHKYFQVKKLAKFQILKKSLIAGIHVHLNCSSFYPPQTD